MKRNFNVDKYNGRKTMITKDVKISQTENQVVEKGKEFKRAPDSDRNKMRHSFNNDK